jgi:hypothetical protein
MPPMSLSLPNLQASVIYVCAALVLSCPSIGRALPFDKTCKLALIDKITLTEVAPTFSHNGRSQNVKTFASNEDKQSIIKAYLEKWQHTEQEPFNARVDDSGRWMIVSKVIGACFHTLQIDKSAYKTSGYLSTLSLETDKTAKTAAPVDLGKHVPKLYGSQVLSDISHTDPGKKARTLVIENKFSPDANAEFYLRTIGEDGWRTTSDHQIPGKLNRREARALTFNKKLETQIIVITQGSQGSNVVIQWMEKP